MEKELVPYEQALALKELKFDKLCFATYDYKPIENRGIKRYEVHSQKSLDYKNNIKTIQCILAPTFSQAFRWFREKYGLYGLIDYHLTPDLARYTILKENDLVAKVLMAFGKYEKAELECLKKLIEIVKEK